MRGFVISMAAVFLILYAFLRIGSYIDLEQKCTGRLKRAADANTVQLAKQELEVAVNWLQQKEYTSGYTSIIYKTPDEDIGFWYNNLLASLEELEEIVPESTKLEKSNILMKLRETLMDESELTVPSGMIFFPHNRKFAILLTLIIVFGAAGWLIIASDL